jgi:predicted DNA-binding transcriptional regulator AlpA
VVRVTGHHRCTISRWIKARTFPPKRGGGGRGWLRSDVDEWLASGAVAPQQFATIRRSGTSK